MHVQEHKKNNKIHLNFLFLLELPVLLHVQPAKTASTVTAEWDWLLSSKA